MPRLSFIEDSAFDAAVLRLVTRVRDADSAAMARLERNVRDPFALMAQALLYDLDPKALDVLDSQRTLAQAISAAIGEFHQHVLGAMPGWENHDALVDLVNEERRIAAEVKNKHNTLNADNKRQVLDNIESFLRSRGGGTQWQGFFITIIPKKPGQEPKEVRTRVKEIDGRSFYELASGEADALDQVFHLLPERLVALGATPNGPSEAILEHCAQIFRQAHGEGKAQS